MTCNRQVTVKKGLVDKNSGNSDLFKISYPLKEAIFTLFCWAAAATAVILGQEEDDKNNTYYS